MEHLDQAITYLSDLLESVLEETITQADFKDLTRPQLRFMRIMIRLHNPTVSVLARELKITKPTVTVLVDKLVKKGYVKKVPSEKDRRVVYLVIDRKGKKIEKLRRVAHKKMAREISSGLNETETAILTELLRKIVKK
ncbi:MAG: MarR family winged helix-turn-helix transcriptional regulator [Bacteroidales bacterium]